MKLEAGLNKKDKYEVGEILIARKWIKTPRVNVNIRYKIMSIKQDEPRVANYATEYHEC